jgi:hypothetical protein
MRLGTPAFDLGDVTGDGHRDLGVSAVGARFDNDTGERGAIFVVSELHRARGTLPIHAVSCASVFAESIGDDVWQAVGLGDLDGDGFDDFAVGASNYNGLQGAVYVFRGPIWGPHLATDADLILLGDGGAFGYALRAGDLDEDGVPDLVVSAHAYRSTGASSPDGRVYVFSGQDLLALMP